MDAPGECSLYDGYTPINLPSVDEGKHIGYQITRPYCKKIIAIDPIIEDAAKRQGSDARAISCECGQKITYWQIATLLSEQKTLGARVQK